MRIFGPLLEIRSAHEKTRSKKKERQININEMLIMNSWIGNIKLVDEMSRSTIQIWLLITSKVQRSDFLFCF